MGVGKHTLISWVHFAPITLALYSLLSASYYSIYFAGKISSSLVVTFKLYLLLIVIIMIDNYD